MKGKTETMTWIMSQAFTVLETSPNLIDAFFSLSLHFLNLTASIIICILKKKA